MRVLCIDTGSTSVKFATYEIAADERELGRGSLDAIPAPADGAAIVAAVERHLPTEALAFDAISHRIVFGGPDHVDPALASQALLDDLERLAPIDPLHLPLQLAIVRAAAARWTDVPNVLCFDTAFFAALPNVARRLPLPPLGDVVRRYGFHGLSYEYIVAALGDDIRGRTVVAHLGGGASMAALVDGVPIDTTMGFSPLGGLMMGTRPGDLDPGIVLHLLDRGYGAASLRDLFTHRSGLAGVSGTGGDMAALLAARESDPDAAAAVDLFCYSARKQLGSFAAALGGLDRIVFTGGIGERAPQIRAAIVAGCEHLGVRLDDDANCANARLISSRASAVGTHAIPTNESLMLARHAASLASQIPS